MPKLFVLKLGVEEALLGKVMRSLHTMPGVAKVQVELDEPKRNGEDTPPGMQRHYVSVDGETGWQFALRIIAKNPEPTGRLTLMQAFDEAGRSPKSIDSILHNLKADEKIKLIPGKGYSATAKGRRTIA